MGINNTDVEVDCVSPTPDGSSEQPSLDYLTGEFMNYTVQLEVNRG